MTEELAPQLLRLQHLLFAFKGDETMLLGELDGFLCGIAAGPQLLSPAEWLPVTWGGDDASFAKYGVDLNEFIGLINDRYNAVVFELRAGTYSPIYEIDEPHNDVLWEIWLEGFSAAMSLQMPAWERLLDDEDAPGYEAAIGLVFYMNLAEPDFEGTVLADIAKDGIDAEVMKQAAPDELPRLAALLYKASVKGAKPVPVRVTSVGRNDPCPCGSGKKYKRCHGL